MHHITTVHRSALDRFHNIASELYGHFGTHIFPKAHDVCTRVKIGSEEPRYAQFVMHMKMP